MSNKLKEQQQTTGTEKQRKQNKKQRRTSMKAITTLLTSLVIISVILVGCGGTDITVPNPQPEPNPQVEPKPENKPDNNPTPENNPPATSVIKGDNNVAVEDKIPNKDYVADDKDYTEESKLLPGVAVSTNVLLMALNLKTTVEEANQLLSEIGGLIVGGVQGVEGKAEGIMMVQVPTDTHEELVALVEKLEQDPRVKYVVEDVLLEENLVAPIDTASTTNMWCDGTATPNTVWAWETTPTGGNWGLELTRVPQMWNLNQAISKTGNRTLTGVLDTGFADSHEDLSYFQNQTPGNQTEHGTHVTGTIAATVGNGKGTDGVTPFADLVVRTRPSSSGANVFAVRTSFGSNHISGFVSLLNGQPDLKVVNISLGYNWRRGGINSDTSARAQRIANQQGALFGLVELIMTIQGKKLPVIVVAAGNDFNKNAKYANPFANAALEYDIKNIIAVESVAFNSGAAGSATRSNFSNSSGHISAPGSGIMSTSRFAQKYSVCSGTSMAAPHVTGLISYLYSLDPSFPQATISSNPMLDLLQAVDISVDGGAQNRIDAYASALQLDAVNGNSKVLKALLDIDDGTPDGNQRLLLNSSTIYTNEDANADGGVGDNRVDMSDFRRWRDWLLQVENSAALDLDGGAAHSKKDVNGNGTVDTAAAENIYPRGDFNGDGVIARTGSRFVAGAINANKTDLQVLQHLFTSDSNYKKAALPSLINSGDLEIYPLTCLAKDNIVKLSSSIILSNNDLPSYSYDHTNRALRYVYTAPVGKHTAIITAYNADGESVYTASKQFDFTLGGDQYWVPTCKPNFIIPDFPLQPIDPIDPITPIKPITPANSFSADDPSEGGNPDFKKLTMSFDSQSVTVKLEFYSAVQLQNAGNFVYLYGNTNDVINFGSQEFNIRRDNDTNGHFEELLISGNVTQTNGTTLELSFPSAIMSDIANKDIWVYSMNSQDRLPDNGKLNF